MMKIAVCEDNPIELRCLTDLLDRYLATNGNKFQYDTYSDFNQMREACASYDLFLLDYMMPGQNGLSFARDLYADFRSSKTVIFITAYSEIVYDAFEVNTFRFLVKPIEEAKLFKALDDFFQATPEGKLIVKVGGKNHVLDLQMVTYFESQGRRISAHLLIGDPVVFYSKTAELDQSLDPAKFFRVHRSYSINLDRVKSFNCDEVVMENGDKISMSAKKYYDFCEAYLKNMKRSYL